MTRMMRFTVLTILAGMLLTGLFGCASAKGGTPAEKRAYTMDMRDAALADLYRDRPDLKSRVENAPGYGVFSNIGTNLIFVSTGGGYGMVEDNQSDRVTYMKMGEIGLGIGLGLKDFRAVFIFNDRETLYKFITSGWSWGADAEAAAKSGDQGGAADTAGNFHPDIEVYQLTENGVSLSATVSGTKYWIDDDLN